MADFEKAIIGTFKAEGSFQKDPSDTANFIGGVCIGTNLGISAQGYYAYYKKIPSEADLKALTKEQAKQIFKGNYWDKVAGDFIVNQSVAELMFQYAIGGGLGQISDIKDIANQVHGKKILVSNDLPFTKADAQFINGLNQSAFHAAMVEWRKGHYIRVINRSIAEYEKKLGRKSTEAEQLKYTKRKFHKGWLNRLATHVYKP